MARERHRGAERRARRGLGHARTTQRYQKRVRPDEEPLRNLIIQLASDYGGYGIPRILDLLRKRGVVVNRKSRVRYAPISSTSLPPPRPGRPFAPMCAADR